MLCFFSAVQSGTECQITCHDQAPSVLSPLETVDCSSELEMSPIYGTLLFELATGHSDDGLPELEMSPSYGMLVFELAAVPPVSSSEGLVIPKFF